MKPPEAKRLYAQVVMDAATFRLDRAFTYAVPSRLRDRARVGSAVLVPLGKARRVGYITALAAEPASPGELKDIEDLIDEEPFFDESMVVLCEWISDYYLAPLASVYRLVIPPGRSRKLLRTVRVEQDEESDAAFSGSPAALLRLLRDRGGEMDLDTLRECSGHERLPADLLGLLKAGAVSRHSRLTAPRSGNRYVETLRLTEAGRAELESAPGTGALRRAAAQRRALELLEKEEEQDTAVWLRESGVGRQVLRGLESKGLVSLDRRERDIDPLARYSFSQEPAPRHNAEQSKAVQAIRADLAREGTGVFLLHGITGSGKTEVYISAIEETLKSGRTAIALVPEISLTPQTISRFKARLGEEVAVLHSNLSLPERYDQWRRVSRGDCRVVVGARSAIFAPLRDLGLIVIDEEHETSYKESSPPRYHAREVALKRAELAGARVVLGSATPDLGSLYAAREGRWTLLELPRRIDDRPLPQLKLVDMRGKPADGRNLLSVQLVQALGEVWRSGEQAILFLNRRGFASFLQCPACGNIEQCPDCSVSLCFHLDRRLLLCHHCGLARRPPFSCTACGSAELLYLGVGTERVEQELARFLPGLTCIRMDSDTTRRRHAHWDILEAFKAGEAQVLLGTQMVAKGLDMPSVTLVGVINADMSLGLPDFRAAERTFQLLTQVSGRAGRGGIRGRVLVQTSNPEHYAIAPVAAGRPDAFYEAELRYRREASYPPFVSLTNLVFSAPTADAAAEAATAARGVLETAGGAVLQLLGPAPAPISRVRGRYRFHLVARTHHPQETRDALHRVLPELDLLLRASARRHNLARDAVSLAIDVDPTSLL
ncbi:MAG: replication restart helicase PriA [Candidatus Geothermincolia bacterium]